MAKLHEPTTITLPGDIKATAKKEASKYRGGLSHYITNLIKADFEKREVVLLPAKAKKSLKRLVTVEK